MPKRRTPGEGRGKGEPPRPKREKPKQLSLFSTREHLVKELKRISRIMNKIPGLKQSLAKGEGRVYAGIAQLEDEEKKKEFSKLFGKIEKNVMRDFQELSTDEQRLLIYEMFRILTDGVIDWRRVGSTGALETEIDLSDILIPYLHR